MAVAVLFLLVVAVPVHAVFVMAVAVLLFLIMAVLAACVTVVFCSLGMTMAVPRLSTPCSPYSVVVRQHEVVSFIVW